MAEHKPQQPSEGGASRQGMEEGQTRSTDATRKPDRPVDEEDVFGGQERAKKYQDVDSGAAKP